MPTVYQPNNWQVIKVVPKSTPEITHYRILAGWTGSYSYGSSWKLSSGIEQIIDLTFNWKVPQTSGSVYVLNKHQEHMSVATMGVLESVQSSNPDVVLEVVDFGSILEQFLLKG